MERVDFDRVLQEALLVLEKLTTYVLLLELQEPNFLVPGVVGPPGRFGDRGVWLLPPLFGVQILNDSADYLLRVSHEANAMMLVLFLRAGSAALSENVSH